jgi:plastocyanin
VIAALATAALAAATPVGIGVATPVGIGAHEYRFGVYRTAVPAGAVRFNIHDFGEDAHDLMVAGPRGYRSAVSPDVVPGRDVSFVVRLRRAGTYRLICVKPGHAKKGMRATLRVR